MSTTASKAATTPIPVQLSEPEFEAFILPHLSMPKRGPKFKRIGKINGRIHLLSASLLTPVASRHLLLYQSLPISLPRRHGIVWRRTDAPGVGTTANGMVT